MKKENFAIGMFVVILLGVLIGIFCSCSTTKDDKFTDSYYYNLTKKVHPNWSSEQIEEFIFIEPVILEVYTATNHYYIDIENLTIREELNQETYSFETLDTLKEYLSEWTSNDLLYNY